MIIAPVEIVMSGSCRKQFLQLLFSVLNVLDVNECTNDTHNCDNNASCQNSVGSFNCSCNPGYDGNGTTCIAMAFIECYVYNSLCILQILQMQFLSIWMAVYSLKGYMDETCQRL